MVKSYILVNIYLLMLSIISYNNPGNKMDIKATEVDKRSNVYIFFKNIWVYYTEPLHKTPNKCSYFHSQHSLSRKIHCSVNQI